MNFYYPIILFSIASYFINFILFKYKLFESIALILINSNSINIWVAIVIAILFLLFFSYKIVEWAIQPKFFIQTKKYHTLIHQIIVLTSIILSTGTYLNLMEGYKIDLNNWNREVLANLILVILFSVSSSLLWNSIYKWIKPALSKIDYIQSNELLKTIKSFLLNDYENEKATFVTVQLKINFQLLINELNNNLIYEPRKITKGQIENTIENATELLTCIELMTNKEKEKEIFSLIKEKPDSTYTYKTIDSIKYFKTL